MGLDTALNNMGAVVIDHDMRVVCRKKLEPADLRFGERVHLQTRNVIELVERFKPVMVAMEDYPLTSRATSHRTAEMVGSIKTALIERKVPYCVVHVAKTKKFVRKVRVVEKAESIEFADRYAVLPPGEAGVLTDCVRSKADKSDIAEAWVIAMIGFLSGVCLHMDLNKMDWTPSVCKDYLERKLIDVEYRWAEILAGGETGILNKPGLIYHPQREQLNG